MLAHRLLGQRSYSLARRSTCSLQTRDSSAISRSPIYLCDIGLPACLRHLFYTLASVQLLQLVAVASYVYM